MGASGNNEFGTSWWALKWNKALNKFGWGSRLQRGRSYARAGRVIDLKIESGVIKAKVQGSSPRPYRVIIEVDKISDDIWNIVIEKLSEKAIFAAKLLAGEIPENIEEAFTTAGTSIFPKNPQSIKANCSCPDYFIPCKHIAAVYYIVGKEFDKDPFLIFKLMGIEKSDLMNRLKQARGIDNNIKSLSIIEDIKSINDNRENLIEEYRRFKELDPNIINMSFFYEKPDIPYALIKRLGQIPFINDEEAFLKIMSLYYDKVSDMVTEELFKD